jgi:hypothetical protein
MPPYAHDAQRLSLLFGYGAATHREVIEWADSQIGALESLPDPLLQLAVTLPGDTAAIMAHLHTLGSGAEFWPAFRAALARLHAHVVAHPRDAARIAHHIYLSVATLSDVPDEFSFVNHFDDAFTLARDGTFGDEDTVRREFIEVLRRFVAAD